MIPPIHQTSTFVQPARASSSRTTTTRARRTRPARRSRGPRRARGRPRRRLRQRDGGDARAAHRGARRRRPPDPADDLYGGTYRLVDKVLARFGLAYDLVDQTDLDAVAAALRDETRLIWVETPTNPLLNVIDIAAWSRGRGPAGRRRQHLRDADRTSARSSSARPPSCTRRPSTSAGTRTLSAAR